MDPVVDVHRETFLNRIKHNIKRAKTKLWCKELNDEELEAKFSAYGVPSMEEVAEKIESFEKPESSLHDLFIENNVGPERDNFLDLTRDYFTLATKENEAQTTADFWLFSGVPVNNSMNFWKRAEKSTVAIKPPWVRLQCSLFLRLIHELHIGRVGSQELRPLGLKKPSKSYRTILKDLLGNEQLFGLGKDFINLVLNYEGMEEKKCSDQEGTEPSRAKSIRYLYAEIPKDIISEIDNFLRKFFTYSRQIFEKSIQIGYEAVENDGLSGLWEIWDLSLKMLLTPHKRIQKRYCYIIQALEYFASKSKKKNPKRKMLIDEYKANFREELTPGEFMIYRLATRSNDFEIGPELLKIHFPDYFPHKTDYRMMFKENLVALIKKRVSEYRFGLPKFSYAALAAKMTPWIEFSNCQNVMKIVMDVLQFEDMDIKGVPYMVENTETPYSAINHNSEQVKISCASMKVEQPWEGECSPTSEKWPSSLSNNVKTEPAEIVEKKSPTPDKTLKTKHPRRPSPKPRPSLGQMSIQPARHTLAPPTTLTPAFLDRGRGPAIPGNTTTSFVPRFSEHPRVYGSTSPRFSRGTARLNSAFFERGGVPLVEPSTSKRPVPNEPSVTTAEPYFEDASFPPSESHIGHSGSSSDFFGPPTGAPLPPQITSESRRLKPSEILKEDLGSSWISSMVHGPPVQREPILSTTVPTPKVLHGQLWIPSEPPPSFPTTLRESSNIPGSYREVLLNPVAVRNSIAPAIPQITSFNHLTAPPGTKRPLDTRITSSAPGEPASKKALTKIKLQMMLLEMERERSEAREAPGSKELDSSTSHPCPSPKQSLWQKLQDKTREKRQQY